MSSECCDRSKLYVTETEIHKHKKSKIVEHAKRYKAHLRQKYSKVQFMSHLKMLKHVWISFSIVKKGSPHTDMAHGNKLHKLNGLHLQCVLHS
jgi:hypothetical protein